LGTYLRRGAADHRTGQERRRRDDLSRQRLQVYFQHAQAPAPADARSAGVSRKEFSMGKYVHPEVLVETDWVKQNLGKPGLKIVDVDVDTKAYDAVHIAGAAGFNWQTQLQNQLTRDVISKEEFEKLVGAAGISPSDTVIIYGDNNNWFAAYGFWLFKMYGHKD